MIYSENWRHFVVTINKTNESLSTDFSVVGKCAIFHHKLHPFAPAEYLRIDVWMNSCMCFCVPAHPSHWTPLCPLHLWQEFQTFWNSQIKAQRWQLVRSWLKKKVAVGETRKCFSSLKKKSHIFHLICRSFALRFQSDSVQSTEKNEDIFVVSTLLGSFFPY